MGLITKDVFQGKFISEWKSALSTKSLEQVDASIGLSTLFSIKDDEELVF